VEAFTDVLERDGAGRAHYLLESLMERARQAGAKIPFSANTPYVNTIAIEEEAQRPGDHDLERRIKSIPRWNAMAMVVHANRDNLSFVGNCNLQRLDGPVRGNGKIIQELEAVFRGSGWNVLKVVWGGNWDPLLAKDRHGILRRRMEEAVDGDYQAYVADASG